MINLIVAVCLYENGLEERQSSVRIRGINQDINIIQIHQNYTKLNFFVYTKKNVSSK